MGFHEIAPKRFHAVERPDNVRVGLRQRSARHGSLFLYIFLGRQVAERLGWDSSTRVVFLFGRDDAEGADAGRIRIRRTAIQDQGVACRRRPDEKRLRLATSKLPDEFKHLPVCAFDADYAVATEAGASDLILTLPFATLASAKIATRAQAAKSRKKAA